MRKLNSFGLNSTARWFCEAFNIEELSEAVAFAKDRSLDVFVLGSGTNLILGTHIDGLVIKNNLRGRTFSENQLKASSGENWEELVRSCDLKGFQGLENLGLIPGTVGAAPIQNIGAYGVELSDRLKSVEALNLFTSETVTFSNTDCEFSYRDSKFKKEKEWCVTSITISSGNELVWEYPDVRIYLEKHNLEMSSGTIYRAVCVARKRKLPDLRRFPNVGSFFKNPVVTAEKYKILESQFPNIPGYVYRHGIKLSAAWLIDSLDLKGQSIGGVSISRQHALVIINHSAGTFDDLKKLSKLIKTRVHSAYDVSLEIEPEVLPEQPI